jgi:ribose transport system permease protein
VNNSLGPFLYQLLSDYGIIVILLFLCVVLSIATYDVQHPNTPAAGAETGVRIVRERGAGCSVLIVTRDTNDDRGFAAALEQQLVQRGAKVLDIVRGNPRDARDALEKIARSGTALDVIACNQSTSKWAVFSNLESSLPELSDVRVVWPESYRWPNFLKTTNLLNVADQISVIAIIAIGMTMVIITAGIDLSVGSLIALSAVVVTWLVRATTQSFGPSLFGMIVCCLAAILCCCLMGLFSGSMIAFFRIPPFIATLAMMLIASGLAFMITRGESIFENIPDAFMWLGRRADLFGIPNSVVLMLVLYVVAHIIMSSTVLGRYIYAVGGNREAARLSGISVRKILLFVYGTSGALAGLGGVVMASQLKSGKATFGQMYELDVIAAVVVGGTSLAGGEGKVFGTLIGAFIIAVIRNGMNLLGIDPYPQRVVLGMVILIAVFLDMLKKQGWSVFRLAKEA